MDMDKNEETLNDIRAAMLQGDGNRAVYLLTKHVLGGDLTEETTICNPDTGKPIAYLVPPTERHKLLTVEEFRELEDNSHKFRSSLGGRNKGLER